MKYISFLLATFSMVFALSSGAVESTKTNSNELGTDLSKTGEYMAPLDFQVKLGAYSLKNQTSAGTGPNGGVGFLARTYGGISVEGNFFLVRESNRETEQAYTLGIGLSKESGDFIVGGSFHTGTYRSGWLFGPAFSVAVKTSEHFSIGLEALWLSNSPDSGDIVPFHLIGTVLGYRF